MDWAGAQLAYLQAKALGDKEHELADFLPPWGMYRGAGEQDDDQLLGALLKLKDKYVKE